MSKPKSGLLSLFARLWAIAALVASSAVHAQSGTGTVTGRVLNQGTQEYLRNAVVTVVGTALSTTAGDGGNFQLLGVPAGPQTLRFTYVGLAAKDQTVNVTPGQTVSVDVALGDDPTVVKLESFVVKTEREGNAKAIMEQKNSIEAKRVLATDTFGSISEGNVAEFVKYLPGVMVDYVEADARSVSLGGLDPKYTSITLDGAPIASSGMAAAGRDDPRSLAPRRANKKPRRWGNRRGLERDLGRVVRSGDRPRGEGDRRQTLHLSRDS